MTERELMLSGQLYDPLDPDLVEGRLRARDLLRELNAARPRDRESILRLMRALLGTCPDNAWIEPPFQCDYGVNIHLGAQVYFNFNCVILDCARVEIGAQTMCGPNVQIYAATHPLDATQRCAGRELARPVTIGTRVWIGGGAIICPGVTIGEDSVIGAGSVVTRDVPPRAFAAGNPARVIRRLEQAGPCSLPEEK